MMVMTNVQVGIPKGIFCFKNTLNTEHWYVKEPTNNNDISEIV